MRQSTGKDDCVHLYCNFGNIRFLGPSCIHVGSKCLHWEKGKLFFKVTAALQKLHVVQEPWHSEEMMAGRSQRGLGDGRPPKYEADTPALSPGRQPGFLLSPRNLCKREKPREMSLGKEKKR